MIFFHEKSSALDRTINSPYGLIHSFFFNVMIDNRVKLLVFFNQLAYAVIARFFFIVLLYMQWKYSFFLEKCLNKNIKWSFEKRNMAIMKTKNANFEDEIIISSNILIFFIKKSKKIPWKWESCKKIWNSRFWGIFW